MFVNLTNEYPRQHEGGIQKRKFFHTIRAQKSYYVSATAIVIETAVVTSADDQVHVLRCSELSGCSVKRNA